MESRPKPGAVRLRALSDVFVASQAVCMEDGKKGRVVKVRRNTGNVTYAIAAEDVQAFDIVKLDVREREPESKVEAPPVPKERR